MVTKLSKIKSVWILVILMFFISACKPVQTIAQPTVIAAQPTVTLQPTAFPEVAVVQIPLSAPLDKPAAEISGLTWAGEWLILLPQYPARFDQQLFRIQHDEILAYFDSEEMPAIEPVVLNSNGLEKYIAGFEGFESICSDGMSAYLTIEASAGKMQGYIVRGEWSADFSTLTLEPETLTEIDPQANLSNMSDESVVVFGRRVVTFYEANGINVNPQPKAHLFDLDLHLTDQLSFPQLEYRVTDASQPDESGQFWVINYFFPGDTKLKPAEDPMVERYGQGASHAESKAIEQLVALQFSEQGIVLADVPPVRLQLLPDDEARNWEGLVTLDNIGFLLATDKFPETILAFVPFP